VKASKGLPLLVDVAVGLEVEELQVLEAVEESAVVVVV